ncbi:hypothetical protein [Xenorhabdus bovienii]|uniref:hypothetical protein n=1 Tax=Xenorhabdus bovienii TaxID=40576 RepID=UPI0023B28ED0|nr:hypothetical protein [Xenorhabdus bovienii]MDE9483413.1 hypothetical protein [Xenorhabdus bovienii]
MLKGIFLFFCAAFLLPVTIATIALLYGLFELTGEDKVKNYSFRDWVGVGVVVVIPLGLCCFLWSQLADIIAWIGPLRYR